MQWGQGSWVACHPSPTLEERYATHNEPGLATYKIKSESRGSFKFFQCGHIEKSNNNNNKKEVQWLPKFIFGVLTWGVGLNRG